MLTIIFCGGLEAVWSVCWDQITMNNMEVRDDVSYDQCPQISGDLGDKVYDMHNLSECSLCGKASVSSFHPTATSLFVKSQ